MIVTLYFFTSTAFAAVLNNGNSEYESTAPRPCRKVEQECSGYTQDEGNAECCSGYCHMMKFDRDSGYMWGLCEEQCYLNGQGCFGQTQYEADAECCSGS